MGTCRMSSPSRVGGTKPASGASWSTGRQYRAMRLCATLTMMSTVEVRLTGWRRPYTWSEVKALAAGYGSTDCSTGLPAEDTAHG